MALILPLSTLQAASHQSYADLPEQELWDNLRLGQEAALACIHRNYYKSLFRYGLKLSQDVALSEDCIQDLFVTLWASRERIKAVQSIKLYLFTSYRRLILQHKKAAQKAFSRFFYQQVNCRWFNQSSN